MQGTHPPHRLIQSREAKAPLVTANSMNFPLVGTIRDCQALDLSGSGSSRGWKHSMARTVLVVDDDPLVLEVTAAMLANLRCEVLTAKSATEALKRLAVNQQIEVLITDINMAGLSAWFSIYSEAIFGSGSQVHHEAHYRPLLGAIAPH